MILDLVQKRVREIVVSAFPNIEAEQRLYFPDSEVDWQQVAEQGQVFVRIHPSQLVMGGLITTNACYVDVCHETYRQARQSASVLVTKLNAQTRRNPSSSISPNVVAVEGPGYWVMNVRFVLKVKTP